MASGITSPNLFSEKAVNQDGVWLEARGRDGAVLDLKIEATPEGRSLTIPAGCQASLIEKFESLRSDPYTTQSKLRITVADQARLLHHKLVHEGPLAVHHCYLEVEVRKE